MTKNRLFGTDGIRGNINAPLLSPQNVLLLGRILARLVKQRASNTELLGNLTTAITIGRDTRASGPYLEKALAAGISSEGVDCHLVGVIPTSAVAWAGTKNRSVFSVMISASHNPYHDNGLKIFGPNGFKIGADLERKIEKAFFSKSQDLNPCAEKPGQFLNDDTAAKQYIAMISETCASDFSLADLKIVVDCANGAASFVAPQVFAHLNSSAIFIGNKPDGLNINRDFGSEAPSTLSQAVTTHQADLGIAFDGDADRVIFVDEKGQVIEGDAIMSATAIGLKAKGLLTKDTLTTTIMSSIALVQALAPHKISVTKTDVGDKFVAQKMLEEGFSFGGESSGHYIVFPQSTTGDGLLFAVKFLEFLKESKQSLSQFLSFFKPSPKLLKNVEVKKKIPLTELPKTQAAINKANAHLNDLGRVMLRYSGTENKARLFVEAKSDADCKKIADEILLEFGDEIVGKS